jgi:hypothetical protein
MMGSYNRYYKFKINGSYTGTLKIRYGEKLYLKIGREKIMF